MNCRICDNTSRNSTYDVQEKLFGLSDVFTYFECASCGCLQIKEIPADMARYYPESYYSYNITPTKQNGNSLKKLQTRLKDTYAVFNKGLIGKLLFAVSSKSVLRSLSRINLTLESRIVDVGCGSGALLYSLKNIGFNNLLGADPFIGADFTYPNGLTIRTQTVADVEGEWDLVMFHHSFEHVADPLETLQSVAKLLADGGVCLLRFPTVSSYAWEHYRTNWVQLDAPRHFYLHSLDSIRLLAEKAGLHLEKVVYDSTLLQFYGSEQYEKGIPYLSEESFAINPKRSIFTAAQIRSFKKKAKALNRENRGDQVAVYLRKK